MGPQATNSAGTYDLDPDNNHASDVTDVLGCGRDPDRHAHRNRHAGDHRYGDADRHADAHRYTHAHAHADAHADRHVACDRPAGDDLQRDAAPDVVTRRKRRRPLRSLAGDQLALFHPAARRPDRLARGANPGSGYDDAYSGLGDPMTNSFYLVRSLDAAGWPAPFFNRVGEFHFALAPGSQ